LAESIVARLARSLAFWAGPNEGIVPEDDTAAGPPSTGEIMTRSGETFVVPAGWLQRIAENEDAILARGGGLGLKLYEELLDDDVAMSNFQQRRLAVISRAWEVSPGDDKDPRSVEAADHLRAQLERLSFDRICANMLFAVWFGYAVAEGLYELGPDGRYRLRDIIVPDRRWFGFTGEGELRFRPAFTLSGQELPPNKFWVVRTGASHDFAFYGLGLAHWCYWPIWFKRNVIRFWALYLEKLGYPTVVGEYNSTMTAEEKADFLKTLVSIGRDRAVAVPEGSSEKIGLKEATRSGAGSSSYGDFVTEQNEALMRVILGQPGTSKATPQGVGGTQAQVHADVKAEIVKADADLLCESFNSTFPVWLTRWNFGEDVAPPRVYRVLEEPEDVDSIADRDVKLDGIGIKRTDASIEEVYGPGYERQEPPPQLTPGAPGMPNALPAAANDAGNAADRRAAFAAQDVAPLYVYRQLTNPRPLLAWARAQGIPGNLLEPADQLHVTVLYSREPVDWFGLSSGWGYDAELKVPPGGPRKLERLGKEGAIVLRFASDDLKWSHERKIAAGASHDFEEYLPHVTIAYDPEGKVDLEAVEPYVGELKFGPEMFEAIEAAPLPGIEPVEFSAQDEDAIGRLAELLADETNPVILEFGATLKEALAGVTNPEAARVALLNAFERMPADRMATIAGLPFVLERMTAEAGIEA
jgi:hypothetical protein